MTPDPLGETGTTAARDTTQATATAAAAVTAAVASVPGNTSTASTLAASVPNSGEPSKQQGENSATKTLLELPAWIKETGISIELDYRQFVAFFDGKGNFKKENIKNPEANLIVSIFFLEGFPPRVKKYFPGTINFFFRAHFLGSLKAQRLFGPFVKKLGEEAMTYYKNLVDTYEEQIAALNDCNSKLRHDIKVLQEENEMVHLANKTIQKDAGEKVASSEEGLKKRQDEMCRLADKIKQNEDLIKQLKKNLADQKEEYHKQKQSLQSTLKDLRSQLSEANGKKDSTSLELSQVQANLQSAIQNKNDSDNHHAKQVEDLNNRNQAQQKALSQKSIEIQAAKKRNDDDQKIISDITSAKDAIKQEKDKIEQELQSTREKLDEQRKQLEQEKTRASHLEAGLRLDLQKLTEKQKEEQQALAQAKTEIENLKKELAAAKTLPNPAPVVYPHPSANSTVGTAYTPTQSQAMAYTQYQQQQAYQLSGTPHNAGQSASQYNQNSLVSTANPVPGQYLGYVLKPASVPQPTSYQGYQAYYPYYTNVSPSGPVANNTVTLQPLANYPQQPAPQLVQYQNFQNQTGYLQMPNPTNSSIPNPGLGAMQTLASNTQLNPTK